MTVRIRKTCDSDQTVLWVDGYLTVEDVGELDLLSADSSGMKCLRELISLGAEIRGNSPYIALLLEKKP